LKNPSKKIPLQTNLSHKRNRATELVSKREKQISAGCKRELEKDDEERRRYFLREYSVTNSLIVLKKITKSSNKST